MSISLNNHESRIKILEGKKPTFVKKLVSSVVKLVGNTSKTITDNSLTDCSSLILTWACDNSARRGTWYTHHIPINLIRLTGEHFYVADAYAETYWQGLDIYVNSDTITFTPTRLNVPYASEDVINIMSLSVFK